MSSYQFFLSLNLSFRFCFSLRQILVFTNAILLIKSLHIRCIKMEKCFTTLILCIRNEPIIKINPNLFRIRIDW
jgi:hypothetical protein